MDQVEEILAALVGTVPGATMAGLVGLDGIGVQVAFSDAWRDADPEVAEVELATLAEAVQRAANQIAGSTSPEFFLGTVQANFLGEMVDPSYFLVLGLEPTGDLARAREALKQARESLAG